MNMTQEEDLKIQQYVLELMAWGTSLAEAQEKARTRFEEEKKKAQEVDDHERKDLSDSPLEVEDYEPDSHETILLHTELDQDFPDSMDVFQSSIVSGDPGTERCGFVSEGDGRSTHGRHP
jgi:hypothetical protein